LPGIIPDLSLIHLNASANAYLLCFFDIEEEDVSNNAISQECNLCPNDSSREFPYAILARP
jgi:hypothetical protein